MDLDAVQEKLPGRLVGVERWRPLDGCNLKINFDAMYRAPSRASCVGIVIRNAVSLGLDLGFQDVVVEGDALIVILKVLSSMSDNLVLGAYIRDNKLWLLPEWDFMLLAVESDRQSVLRGEERGSGEDFVGHGLDVWDHCCWLLCWWRFSCSFVEQPAGFGEQLILGSDCSLSSASTIAIKAASSSSSCSSLFAISQTQIKPKTTPFQLPWNTLSPSKLLLQVPQMHSISSSWFSSFKAHFVFMLCCYIVSNPDPHLPRENSVEILVFGFEVLHLPRPKTAVQSCTLKGTVDSELTAISAEGFCACLVSVLDGAAQ
ncbi:hypothetical protein Godav_010022 [Gossypium davidsonii]|uniref:RNase H type-1 domain-containing protein n=1 Tax=Gossypium davidsonii TaxID=34287 RepID=A0A7J8SF22_GOSDV|nr:hypothetical protein [Gossypium davidsonii]